MIRGNNLMVVLLVALGAVAVSPGRTWSIEGKRPPGRPTVGEQEQALRQLFTKRRLDPQELAALRRSAGLLGRRGTLFVIGEGPAGAERGSREVAVTGLHVHFTPAELETPGPNRTDELAIVNEVRTAATKAGIGRVSDNVFLPPGAIKLAMAKRRDHARGQKDHGQVLVLEGADPHPVKYVIAPSPAKVLEWSLERFAVRIPPLSTRRRSQKP